MIGVERLRRSLQIIGASAAVRNGMGPLSANLISPSGAGKTELMLSCMPPDTRVMNDVTTMTLMKIIREPKPPKYLMIPDLNIVISHKPVVAELTMAMLLSLMAEGVMELNPGLDNAVKVRMTRARKTGLRMALVTGMTPEMFWGKRGKWRSTGLLRRMLPINYKYSFETSRLIQDSITNGQDSLNYSHSSLPRMAQREVRIQDVIRAELRQLSEYITTHQLVWSTRDRDGRARKVQAEEYPFSMHKVLRQLARSSAAFHDRAEVTPDDVSEVMSIAKFIRYDRPEEI